ncbi:MAG: threonine/serine exporter family protein [Acidobacteria bacterium]|nr:threonine/serine exporter family protein [Acidobacteriota bacterium]
MPIQPPAVGTVRSAVPKRSAKPISSGVPTVPLAPRPANANYAARRVLRRLVQGEAPPTAPLSIVDRLAGSPYANPMIQVAGVDASARKTIDFALHLAETMFRYGAGALEVETSIIAVTAALGLRHIDVDITNQSVVLNYAPKDTTPITLVRVVRSWTNNYAGLALIHELVSDIVAGGVGRDECNKRLETIVHRPKPFPRWTVTVSTALFAGIVVAVIGGGLWGAAVAVATNFLVSYISRVLGRWRVPDFFITAASSFVVTAIALVLALLQVPLTPAVVVTGGILLLLPSGRLVSAVQDAINGFPVTAAGRFLSATFTFAAIVSGIAVSLALSAFLGAGNLDVTQAVSGKLPLLALIPMVFVGTLAIGVAEQTQARLLLVTGVIGTVSYAVVLAATALGLGDRLAPALAAVVAGMLARIVALRMGAPQLVVAVPAILFLLTGLSIFRAMFVITITPDDTMNGVVGLFNAFVVIMAVAAGTVLGDNMGRPFTKGLTTMDKRRNRRR